MINCPSDLPQMDGLFSFGSPVSSTNKTESQDMAEILLKVALNTITLALRYNPYHTYAVFSFVFNDFV